MKLIIEIDDIKYQNIVNTYSDNNKIYAAIKNGTPIPDNATNGEVLDLMFPYEKTIAPDWFNAPYQKGGKE